MLELILFLFLAVSQALKLSPAETISKCEENIMRILEHPQEGDDVLLINNLNEYIYVVNNTTEDFKADENQFEVCKTMRFVGWPDFLLCELNSTTHNVLKKKFKWNDKKFKEFQSLMRKAEHTWMDFMEYFYEQTE